MLQNQSNITAGGSVGGRDVITTNNYFTPSNATQIARLYAKFKIECAEGANAPAANGFIEDLQHFLDRPARQMSRTLQEKLVATERESLVETAEEAKERATKRIMRFQSSQTAQEIFAYVLGDLHTRFTLYVAPLIASKASRQEIDEAIAKQVIQPVAESMEPSTLGLNSSQVFAFLFYLAGNCHIQWD